MSTGFEKIGSDYRLQNHWIRRLIAFVIDSIIVGIGTFVVSIPFTIAAAATGLPWFFFNPLIGPFFLGCLSVLYFALLEYLYGWTFGKRIMTLETMKTDGQKPSLDAAFIRNVSKIYWILLLLDVIIGLATPGDPHQKITDRVAGTTVASATFPQPSPPSTSPSP